MSDCTRTVEDLRSLLKTCKDFDSQQTVNFYDSWAETYEQDLALMSFKSPHLAVDFFHENFSGSCEDVWVLDVACGCGWVAKLVGNCLLIMSDCSRNIEDLKALLKTCKDFDSQQRVKFYDTWAETYEQMVELGFKHFAGVDGSEGMLGKAAETGLYQDLKQALLGPEPLPFQSDSFDVVIIVGALRHNFVPVSVIRELCNVAKPGGYICMSRNCLKLESANTYKESMEKELQLMEEEGLWTHVISKEMEKYMKHVYKIDIEDQENEGYSGGTMYLYRKTLK